MTLPKCCNKANFEVHEARAWMVRCARSAAARGHERPELIEKANQAKADYIRKRALQIEHDCEVASA